MKRTLPFFVSIAFAAFGASDKTTFQAKPAADYPNKQTSEKVTIAAEQFITDEQTKDAFGKVNPWRYGVLPVLIVIQNDSAAAIRVDKIKFSYLLPDRTHVEATPAGDVKYLHGVKTPAMRGTTLPNIHLGKGSKNPLDEWEIEGRAFAAKVIPAGQSASGFVYFQTENSSAASAITISGLVNAVSGAELYYFEIPLSGK